MKNLIIILTLAMVFSSCLGRGSKQAQSQQDSLETAIRQKDSLLNSVYASLGVITENLSLIKSRENVISTSVNNGEIHMEAAAQIEEDIAAIDELLKSNRETISRLQRDVERLRRADVDVAALEKLIMKSKAEVDAKNSEIAELRVELARMNVKVEELNTMVDELSTEVETISEANVVLEQDVKEKTRIITTAYYMVGPEKELISKGVVEKSGFVGRTVKAASDLALDNFTQVDRRNFDEVILGKKKVTLVTTHPEGSYEWIMGDKKVYRSLVIKDKEKFWESSKVLIITFK